MRRVYKQPFAIKLNETRKTAARVCCLSFTRVGGEIAAVSPLTRPK